MLLSQYLESLEADKDISIIWRMDPEDPRTVYTGKLSGLCSSNTRTALWDLVAVGDRKELSNIDRDVIVENTEESENTLIITIAREI